MSNNNQADWITPEVLDNFNIVSSTQFTATKLTGGFQHEVWKVTSNDGPIILKRQISEPNPVGIELETIAENSGIAVAKIIAPNSNTKSKWLEIKNGSDSHYIRAYECIVGSALDREAIAPELATTIGEELAKLHTVSMNHNLPLTVTSLPAVNFADDTGISELIKNTTQRFTTNFDASRHIAIIGHRDMGGKNIVVESKTNTPYIIDFDEAGFTTVDGEVIDAAFNLGGVHSAAGVNMHTVLSFIDGYNSASDREISFTEDSFHMLIGMSECWWLAECFNRIKNSTNDTTREQSEIDRLLKQIPADVAQIPAWLEWLNK